nr:HYD1 signature containing ADP-ribosyltransferase family protein [Acinetobacter sichuanensis]
MEWVDPLGLNKVCTCCPPVPSGKNVFYHYTDTAGMAGILTSQKLFPSLKANNPKDARYGDGQYVTDIIPRSQSDKSIAKALYNKISLDMLQKFRIGLLLILRDLKLRKVGEIISL